MHRSNFRATKASYARKAPDSPHSSASGTAKSELDAIREQIMNVRESISPLTASMERLAAPKKDISVPDDIAQALRLAHGRLDRLEAAQKDALSELRRMATAFSNALLKLGDQVETHEGALAHSLEKLISVLESRKLKIIRNGDGDMVGVETVSAPQE